MVVPLVCRALLCEIQCTSRDLLLAEVLPSLKLPIFESFLLELECDSEI